MNNENTTDGRYDAFEDYGNENISAVGEPAGEPVATVWSFRGMWNTDYNEAELNKIDKGDPIKLYAAPLAVERDEVIESVAKHFDKDHRELWTPAIAEEIRALKSKQEG